MMSSQTGSRALLVVARKRSSALTKSATSRGGVDIRIGTSGGSYRAARERGTGLLSSRGQRTRGRGKFDELSLRRIT